MDTNTDSAFEPFVSEAAAAAALGMKAKFLEEDRATRRHGIPFYRFGNRVRYRLSEVMAWAAKQAADVGTDSF